MKEAAPAPSTMVGSRPSGADDEGRGASGIWANVGCVWVARSDSSCSPPFVAMVETADAGQCDNLGALVRSRLDGSRERAILVQSKVCPILMMVFNVRPEELAKVVFLEGYNMVQELSPERAAPSLAESVLPWASHRPPHRNRAKGPSELVNGAGELGVVVIDQRLGRAFERERFPQLLSDPGCTGCSRHAEVDDRMPGVVDKDEDVQHVEGDRGNREEVHGGNALAVVPQGGLPAVDLVRLSGAARHVARDCSLGDVESQHLQLAMDARRAPTSVAGHPYDQPTDFAINSRTARRASSRFPGREETEAPSMPTDDGVRLNDDQGVAPAGQTMKQDPEEAVALRKRSGAVASV